jgi:hypothetical protein
MATSSAILKVALDRSVRELTADLQVLSQQLPPNQPGLYITHDMADIQVKGLLSLKAYVPKKYNGFNVVFTAVAHDELLSLTSTIIQATAKHGIFTP